MKQGVKQEEVIIVTRPKDVSRTFATKLEKLGFSVVSVPSIVTSRSSLSSISETAIKHLIDFDWIIFTSSRGVEAFFYYLKQLKIDKDVLRHKKIAVVGTTTAKSLTRYGLVATYTPSIFTTATLAQQIPEVSGKNILLPRANIASKKLATLLTKRGAYVTNIPIYQTKLVMNQLPEIFAGLVAKEKIRYITFTSPSTVNGFMKNVDKKIRHKVLNVPVLSIGPVTTVAAKKYGFKHTITAEVHTIDGMVAKIKEQME